MRSELSSLDIHYLIKEFQILIGGKIDKIYQDKENFIFQCHIPNIGKKFLMIKLPTLIYLSDHKLNIEESEKFALSLRKHLSNSRIRKIEQKEFERIIEFQLEFREKKLKLIVELFRPGNIILCNEDYKIIMGLSYKGFGSRLIRPGIKYEYPKKELNFLELNESNLVQGIEKSDKNSIVVTMATNFGLGGLYAEELCLRSGIDKKKSKLSLKEIKQLYNEIEKLRAKNIQARIYFDKNKNIDITPFELNCYKDLKSEICETLNSGFDKTYFEENKLKSKLEKRSKIDKEKAKIESIIKKQEIQINGLELSALENQKKAELIYKKYQFIEHLLQEILEIRKKHSWEEIIKKTKGHKVIKQIIPKENKITIEI